MSAAEEWADADFDIPDDHPIAGNGHGWEAPAAIVLRPPLVIDDDDDEEGVSTIKVDQATLRQTQPLPLTTKAPEHDDTDDFEDGFALPDDLTQLSLAPITLSHRASRESWGEKDQTCSSQSSDAYSTLGLADGASSSSATSASIGSTDDDEDSCDDDLDGLVIPAAVFDHNAAKHLKKTLELRQRPPLPALGSTSQDDFEQDLIIDDEVDLSPSRLLHGTHRQRSLFARSSSLPEKKPSLPHRPPSRLLKSERAKSPNNPPPSASSRQLNKLRLSPSPPLLRPSSRTQSFQAALNSPNGPSGKSSSLRGQKSHSGLKPPSPSSSTRGLRRKASLSSLMETSSQAIPPPPTAPAQNARYDAPTAASRARHKASSTRLASKEYIVPPTRPSTPATNTAALRLTLPTQGRLSKSRPALATVFGATAAGSHSRTNSPLPPPRPPSANSSRPPRSQPSQSSLVPPKVLRRPKRPRTFGDGTELDAFEDLPTDMSKESRFRVQPKDYGNRVVGGTYSSSSKVDANKGTLRRKQRRESSSGAPTPTAFASTTNLRAASKPEPVFKSSPQKKKKVNANHTRRKPALISGLGVTTGEKVVGNMKWNPHSLRWEGNEQVLRDFDAAVGTSSRPALITHLTGSSIGSPAGTFSSGARIVGNMMFDPAQMCWISTLPPDEEEPDVFANLADDEDDDDSWAKQAGTIRASIHTTTSSTGAEDTLSRSPNSSTSSSSVAAQARSRAVSVSGSDRGSRASLAFDIDEDFVKACRVAAVRHRQEMKGWRNTLNKHTPLQHSSADSAERTSLYEIRAIARRNYED